MSPNLKLALKKAGIALFAIILMASSGAVFGKYLKAQFYGYAPDYSQPPPWETGGGYGGYNSGYGQGGYGGGGYGSSGSAPSNMSNFQQIAGTFVDTFSDFLEKNTAALKTLEKAGVDIDDAQDALDNITANVEQVAVANSQNDIRTSTTYVQMILRQQIEPFMRVFTAQNIQKDTSGKVLETVQSNIEFLEKPDWSSIPGFNPSGLKMLAQNLKKVKTSAGQKNQTRAQSQPLKEFKKHEQEKKEEPEDADTEMEQMPEKISQPAISQPAQSVEPARLTQPVSAPISGNTVGSASGPRSEFPRPSSAPQEKTESRTAAPASAIDPEAVKNLREISLERDDLFDAKDAKKLENIAKKIETAPLSKDTKEQLDKEIEKFLEKMEDPDTSEKEVEKAIKDLEKSYEKLTKKSKKTEQKRAKSQKLRNSKKLPQ